MDSGTAITWTAAVPAPQRPAHRPSPLYTLLETAARRLGRADSTTGVVSPAQDLRRLVAELDRADAPHIGVLVKADDAAHPDFGRAEAADQWVPLQQALTSLAAIDGIPTVQVDEGRRLIREVLTVLQDNPGLERENAILRAPSRPGSNFVRSSFGMERFRPLAVTPGHTPKRQSTAIASPLAEPPCKVAREARETDDAVPTSPPSNRGQRAWPAEISAATTASAMPSNQGASRRDEPLTEQQFQSLQNPGRQAKVREILQPYLWRKIPDSFRIEFPPNRSCRDANHQVGRDNLDAIQKLGFSSGIERKAALDHLSDVFEVRRAVAHAHDSISMSNERLARLAPKSRLSQEQRRILAKVNVFPPDDFEITVPWSVATEEPQKRWRSENTRALLNLLPDAVDMTEFRKAMVRLNALSETDPFVDKERFFNMARRRMPVGTGVAAPIPEQNPPAGPDAPAEPDQDTPSP